MHNNLPTWFEKTTNQLPSSNYLRVNHHKVNYLSWGKPDKPWLIFIHGGFANAHWYAHIAPLFTDDFYVISLNLSGHGDSDWKESYILSDFISEIQCLANQSLTTPYHIVAHSFGARLAFMYSKIQKNPPKSLVMLDPPDLSTDPQKVNFDLPIKRKIKHYPLKETLISRFKIIPPQPISNDFILKFIANQSIVSTDQGYQWKSDPNFFSKIKIPKNPQSPENANPLLPSTIIYGQYSTITSAQCRSNIQKAHPHIKQVVLKNAYHALMIDQPLELVSLIKQNL